MARVKGTQKKYDIDYRYNFKQFWYFALKHKGLFFASVFVVIVIELLNSADRFFFKGIIDNGTLYAAGSLPRDAFVSFLIALAALFIGVSIGRMVFRFFRVHLINRLQPHLEFELKQYYFNHLIGLSHRFHTTHKTGAFISRINRGAAAMDRMTGFLIGSMLPLLVQFIVIIIGIGFFDTITVWVIGAMALIFIVFSIMIQRLQKPHAIAYYKAEDAEKANLADFFTNIDSIKYFAKEVFIGQRYRALGQNTRGADIRRADYQRWLRIGHTFIISIGTFLIFYFPLQKFLAGQISLGTIALIYALYGGFLPYLGFFVDDLRAFFKAMEDFNDLFEYGKVHNDIEDMPNAHKANIREGAVEFKNVDFSYRGSKLFNRFSLTIPSKKKIALVGRSGSGKTTLVKLLYRLYDVNAGTITIDGVNTKEFTQESLRSELSIVPQEAVLFDDTIYNNILFSRPGASKKEVFDALAFAQLDAFVKKLPQKEHTIVGERGVKLSGGEKQRVSIARALLANKKILVLDEATSSLDSQTEHDIQHDLKELMKGRTSLIIAHRLSTIMSADLIVVLDNGKIVQKGTHAELINQKGMYRRLWELQKGGYLGGDDD